MPYLTLPYLILPYQILPCLTLSYLTLPCLTLLYLTLRYLTQDEYSCAFEGGSAFSSAATYVGTLGDVGLRVEGTTSAGAWESIKVGWAGRYISPMGRFDVYLSRPLQGIEYLHARYTFLPAVSGMPPASEYIVPRRTVLFALAFLSSPQTSARNTLPGKSQRKPRARVVLTLTMRVIAPPC